MKIKYKLFSLLLALATVILSFGSAEAASESGYLSKGSVSLTLKTKSSAVSGAEITLYKVADAKLSGNSLSLAYTKNFAAFGGSPEKLNGEDKASKLAKYAEDKKITGLSVKTGKSGEAKFDNLSLGIYLSVQTKSVKGFSDFLPFLVSVPAKEDEKWVYNIDASPKAVVKGTGTSSERTDYPGSYIDADVNHGAGYNNNNNKNASSLIQTGQLKWPVPVMACAGILLFAVGWLLFNKRKKDHG